ncbi:NACHT domain-containing protein [Pseudomonas extremaustralis]|uniref:NACHT domain-containing protein n=1 Tax=Pseudomonas extremaustralis TaxID=359110 RepID=UPI0023DEF281|nr:NACHT domain-containing protein [Pseudomonas extremaustralis]MDF3135311.1 NACHT domain-containing protein [Pseudomonas extremaustralis]
MVAELTVSSLTKVISPIVTSIAKDLVGVFKERFVNLEASRASELIAGLVLNINTVKTIWSKDRGMLLEEFYYQPEILYKFEKKNIDVSELLVQNSIVEGIVGQGKSMLMRKLCNSVVDMGRIPVFLELRMLSRDRNLTDLILDYLDACSIKGGLVVLQYLAQSGKIALILDGFDEIPSDMVKATVYQIEQFQKKYTSLIQVVSTRPNNAISNLSGFEIFTIAPLKHKDYAPFLNKLIKDVVFKTNVNLAIDQASQSIKGVITTPLMLTLLCLVYENESEIPSSLPDFFDRLFNAVFTRHDKFKVGFHREFSSGLSESKIRKLFDCFCFMTLQFGHGRSMSCSEFDTIFARACKFTPSIECDVDGFKKDIVQVSCLMLEDGFDEIVFLHKSILEYHAAAFIKSSSDEVCKRFYEKCTGNVYVWAEVLIFLSYIDMFRFSKYFILAYYVTELEALTTLLADKSNESLIDYVEARFVSLHVVMKNFSVSSFGNQSPKVDLPLYHELFSEIMHALTVAVSAADTKLLQVAIRQTPSTEKGNIEISFRAAAKNLDLSGIWIGFRDIEQRLIVQVADARKIVESEKLKYEIFE